MFLIRPAKASDLGTLLKLAKMVHFINLPADKDAIADRISWSRLCFRGREREDGTRHAGGVGRGAGGRSPAFMFVIEDMSTGNPVGTSAIISEMGSPGNPNVSMQLRRREFFSEDLQQGVTHVTAQVELDEDGPTEIGGLIIGPSFRGHKDRLGLQLSLIRFHYIGLRRERFKNKLLAEMMAPITPDGRNEVWEAFGRKFINLSYSEADRFCAHSREFMTSLLPREEIYIGLLPAEARASFGKVGVDTVPALRMLERLGFEYRDRVDPFDGGPHMHADTAKVTPVRDTRRVDFGGTAPHAQCKAEGLVSVEQSDPNDEPFRAVMTRYAPSADGKSVRLPKAAVEALGLKKGHRLGLTPLAPKGKDEGKAKTRTARGKAAKATSKKTTSKKTSSKKATPGAGRKRK